MRRVREDFHQVKRFFRKDTPRPDIFHDDRLTCDPPRLAKEGERLDGVVQNIDQ